MSELFRPIFPAVIGPGVLRMPEIWSGDENIMFRTPYELLEKGYVFLNMLDHIECRNYVK